METMANPSLDVKAAKETALIAALREMGSAIVA